MAAREVQRTVFTSSWRCHQCGRYEHWDYPELTEHGEGFVCMTDDEATERTVIGVERTP